MNTIPDCTTDQVASIDHATRADAPARFVNRNLHRLWHHRRMQATLLRPFRKVLRPLLVWLRQEHIHVQSGQPGVPPIGIGLRKVGWESIALGILIGPLVFVMLLPLALILVPVIAIIGVTAIAVSSIQTDQDESEHHSLPWHTMH